MLPGNYGNCYPMVHHGPFVCNILPPYHDIMTLLQVSMRMALSSKPSMMRISTAAGSGVLKDQEVVGSLSFGRLSYENAERTWAVTVCNLLGPAAAESFLFCLSFQLWNLWKGR